MTAQLPLLAATDVAGSPSDQCTATAGSGHPCTRAARSDGRCWQHIPRVIPQPAVTEDGAVMVPTTNGVPFLIDIADYPIVAQHRWSIGKDGYARRWVLLEGRKPYSIQCHRDILGLSRGDGLMGDHLNGDRLDNRRSNLRVANATINNQNSGSSRLRGVTRDGRKFEAAATVDGRKHRLGRFDTAEEAAEVAHLWRLANMPGYVDRRTA